MILHTRPLIQENMSDDIKSSNNYLDFKTKDLGSFLDEVNRGII